MKYSLRSLMTFSIRDIALTTVIVAVLVAWWWIGAGSLESAIS